MASGIVLSSGRFYWNVDANVGLGSPNKMEDVHLVQLAFACKGANMKSTISNEDRAIYNAVVPGAPYTGSPSDPLTVAIKLFQQRRGGIQDGHVSKISTSGTYAPETAFMLVSLNNNVFDVLGAGSWPYIDRHPKSTSVLKDLVSRTFVVPPA